MGQIYMFRDATENLPVSPGEKYSVSSKKWSILRSPHPYDDIHYIFPVKANIYLLTQTESQLSFQVFRSITNRFTKPVVIDTMEDFYGGVYVQATKTILCVRSYGLWTWNWKTNRVKVEETLKGGTNSPPKRCVLGMLVGKEIFWISSRYVYRYDIDNREVQNRCITT